MPNAAQWRKMDKEKARAEGRKWHAAYRVRLRAGVTTEGDDIRWARRWLYAAKKTRPNAKFLVTPESLAALFRRQRGRCALTGITMVRGNGNGALCASLDRVRHGDSYREGNVRWVLFCVNSFRGQMSDAEMLKVARALIRRKKA